MITEQQVRRMQINDSTLREGQQALHPLYRDRSVVFSRQEQLTLTENLSRSGIHYIELGAPVRSPFGLETARQLVEQTKAFPNTQIAVHSRCVDTDIDAALATGTDRLHLYMGTSQQLRSGNGNKSIPQIIDTAKRAVEYARSKKNGLFIRFGTEDAFRTSLEDLVAVTQVLAPHVDLFSLPDTTGRAIPHQIYANRPDELPVYEIVKFIKEMTGKGIQFHGHNDSGLALANYLAAMSAGAEVFDTSAYRLGERNGIPSAKDILLALWKNNAELIKSLYNIETLHQLDQLVAAKLGQELPNWDVFGPHMLADIAGVHTAAQLKSNGAYDANQYAGDRAIIVASSVVGKAAIVNRAMELEIIGRNDFSFQNPDTRILEIAQEAAELVQETAKIQGSITPDQADEIINEIFKKYTSSN